MLEGPITDTGFAEAFRQAVAYHQTGRTKEAGELYRALLVCRPGHPAVSHNLGLLVLAQGRQDEALALLEAAFAATPATVQYCLSYTDALLQCGLQDRAEAVLNLARARGVDAALLAPRFERLRQGGQGLPAIQDLQRLAELFNQGQHEMLERHARELAGKHPDCAPAWKALGLALYAQDRMDEAAEALQRCTVLAPADAEAHNNLGSVLRAMQLHSQAEECFRRAFLLQPDFAAAQRNLALVLREQGRYAEAERCLRDLLRRLPNDALLHSNLGLVFAAQNRMPEAEVCYRKALTLQPDFAECMAQLAHVHRELGRLREAEAGYRAALERAPELAEALQGLGSLYLANGDPQAAVAFLRRAVAAKPGLLAAHSTLLFALNYASAVHDAGALEDACAYGRKLAARRRETYRAWAVAEQPARLKVGFVSGDLRQHPVGFFLEGILPVLDRTRLELIAYPTVHESDLLTEQLKASFSAWRPIAGLDDDAAAALVHADGVHVLIDLSGHTAHNRLGVFARKPAPVQLTWPGYFATTGVAEIDWFIADPVTVPEDQQRYFTERIWYLPETRLCFTPPVDAPAVAPLPMLVRGAPTFGCFQNLNKVSDAVLRVWARIMAELPGARLRLQAKQLGTAEGVERLRARLLACGIDQDRVELHPSVARRRYLEAHAEVDLVLDTFPYTGGTTTCEALWMGVPTLTLAGGTPIARQGASIMRAAGLAEWVVEDADAYVRQAVLLAGDLTGLAQLRSTMRQRLLQTALFDTPRFARDLEQALWGMWQAAGAVARCAPGAAPVQHSGRPAPGTDMPQDAEVGELVALFRSQHYEELARQAEALIARYPDFGLGWKVLGIALKELRRHPEALDAMQRAVELLPEDVEAVGNLGLVLFEMERFPAAAQCHRKALAMDPADVDSTLNLAAALFRLDLIDELVEVLMRALELNPQHFELNLRLAEAYWKQHKLSEAEHYFERAADLGLNDADAHYRLGTLRHEQRRYGEAEKSLRYALTLAPGHYRALANLGLVLQAQNRYIEAERTFREALALKPDLAELRSNLGSSLLAQGRLHEALDCYRQALEQRPDWVEMHSNLLFSQNYAAEDDPQVLFDEALAYGERVSRKVGEPYTHWPASPAPAAGQRLRVGFVSGDLCAHPVGYFLEGILPVLDRTRLELIAYPTVDRSDVFTEQLKASFSDWRPLWALSDEAAAERIHADGVHVLIDLSGHTAYNRLGVFARKPAPVQVSWPGYFATTGVAQIDWFIADRITVPESHRHYFSESVWYLPDTRLCFTPPVDAPPLGPLPMRATGAPTFGCFQNLTKVSDTVLAVWARILAAIPGARLRLQSRQLSDPEGQCWMHQRLQACGIDPARVSLHPSSSRREYLAAHGEVDMILDTFPYTGGTTTCEALWMGVPTLTLVGDTLIARQGASIMQAAGLPGWIVETTDQYIERAIALAAQVDALAQLRAQMRPRLLNTALFDTPRFARHLEDALWGMWGQFEKSTCLEK